MSVPPTGTYKIVSAVDSNCIDASGGGGKKGCKIIQWHYGKAQNQHFQIQPEGQGFRLTNVVREKKSGIMLVLDDNDKGVVNLSDFNGDAHQQWIAVPVSSDGSVLIKNIRTSRCLRSMGHGNEIGLFQEAPEDKSQWWNFIAV